MKRYYTAAFYVPEISMHNDDRVWVTVDRELEAERNKCTMSETVGTSWRTYKYARKQTDRYNRTLTAW